MSVVELESKLREKNESYDLLLTEMDVMKVELEQLRAEKDRWTSEPISDTVEQKPVNHEDQASYEAEAWPSDGAKGWPIDEAKQHCVEAESARTAVDSLSCENDSLKTRLQVLLVLTVIVLIIFITFVMLFIRLCLAWTTMSA